MDINQLLQEIARTQQVTDQQFDQVTHHSTPNELAQGIAETFRSDQTAPMGDMVAQLFGQSNGQQQAGALNQVIAALGPALAASAAGGVLGKLLAPGSTQVTPAQASTLSKDEVKAVVEQAQQQQPNVADGLANFYAQHSGLIKTLGGAALAVALASMKNDLSKRR
jgi:hypothetical protein